MARQPFHEPPRGMDDLLPEDLQLLRGLQEAVRLLFRLYGYSEIETPPLEYYELFDVKSGEEIRSHMFAFADAHGRRLVLRPEMTAPVARLVAGKLSRRPLPLRLGYVADCYRLDEPQWGRRRRFYHGGFELFGSRDPLSDAEMMQICSDFFSQVGIKDYRFKVGHVGVHRAIMRAAGLGTEQQDRVLSLVDRGRSDEALSILREESKDRDAAELLVSLFALKQSGVKEVIGAVREIASPVEEAARQVENLEEVLDLASSVIEEERLTYHPGFARGLEYYTGLIFEVYGGLADVALAGGGRYDELVQLFGGRPTPGVGMAIGITRVQQYLRDRLERGATQPRPAAVLIAISREARRYALRIGADLRRRNVSVETEAAGRPLSEALRIAERRGVRYAVIIGEREAEEGSFILRDLRARIQREYRVGEINEAAQVVAAG